MNWNSSISPTKLLSNGNLETSPRKMADIQNSHYIDKVKAIRESRHNQGRDPLAVLNWNLQGYEASFTSQAVIPEQVDKIIRDLKNSKAS
jgi:hypothetical protein